MLEVINPANGDAIAELAADYAKTVAAKYAAARAAQPAWAARAARAPPGDDRSGSAPRSSPNRDKLAAILTAEVGKPITQSRNELNGLLAAHRLLPRATPPHTLRRADRARRRRHGRAHRARAARRGRQHLGLELPVLRRRQRVRARAARRQRGALQAVRVRDAHGLRDRTLLHASGVPQDVFAMLVGAGDVGAALLAQPVDGVFFTGSDATGKRIAAVARRRPRQGAARARRQGSDLRLRGRRRRRPRRRRSPTARSTTPARAAARSSASTCTPRSTTPSSRPSSPRCAACASALPTLDETYIGPLTRAPQLAGARAAGGRRGGQGREACWSAASASSSRATGSSPRCWSTSTTRWR